MSPTAQVQQLTGRLLTAALTNPPTAFPKVKLGGEEYELRFTFRSTFFLEQTNQVPADDLSAWMQKQYESKHTTSMLMIMCGSMLGREVRGKWKAMPMTGQDLADVVTTEEWTVIAGAYTEALGKVTEAMRAALARLQETTTEPTPTTEAVN